MKAFFLIMFAVFLGLYAIALGTRSNKAQPGVVTLVWETDPNPVRRSQAELFTKLNPGIEIKLAKYSPEKILVKCATGVGPDLVDRITYYNLSQFVDAGILLDLTPYQAEYGFGPESTYPAARDLITVEGRQYAFPANITANCLIYNRRLLRSLGIAEPRKGWTYDQYVAMGRKVRASKGPHGNALLFATSWGNAPFFDALVSSQGGLNFTHGGLVSALDSPQVIAAAKAFRDMIFTDRILLSAAEASSMSSQGGWGSGGIDHFGTQKAAMLFVGRWFLVDAANYPQVKSDLGVAQWPAIPGHAATMDLDARSVGINAKSHHIPEALKFIRYLASEEYNRLVVEDGDSLPPNPRFAGSGKALANGTIPDPAFHQAFVDAAMGARAVDTSPFIVYSTVASWKAEVLSKIESDPAADVTVLLRAAAREVNLRIRRDLERTPFLQRRYTKLTGKAYSKDWWKGLQPE